MRIILSLITLFLSFIWSNSAISIPEIAQGMISGLIAMVSIYFAISAIYHKEVASGLGLFKFFGLLLAIFIIIIDIFFIISFAGLWVVAFFFR
jgi:hypothetical protein